MTIALQNLDMRSSKSIEIHDAEQSVEQDDELGPRFMIDKKIFVNKNHLGRRLTRKNSKERSTILPLVEKSKPAD